MTESYEEKIRELEEQIKQLNERLSKLTEDRDKQITPENHFTSDQKLKEKNSNNRDLQQAKPFPSTTPDREKIGEALTHIKTFVGKNLERKIGLEWATEISAVLVMSTFVLTSRATFFSEIFSPIGKIMIIYGISVIFILLELITKRKSILTDTIISCGLAGIPYATYALFFLSEVRPFSTISYNGYTLTLLLFIIVLSELPLILISHKKKKLSIAGIGLFLNYYTVALSCYGTPDLLHLTYALITSLFIAIATFIFHILHKWFFLSWGGIIGSYLIYAYVFIYLNPNTYLNIPAKPYFWISFAFLTTSFLIFSTTCIIEAKRKNEYRRGVAPLVGLNSFIYFALSFYLIRMNYVEHEYVFRTIFTLLLLAFTIISNLVGEKYNYIFKIFAIKTFIMATLALQSYFSGEKLLIALSIECLALFLAYKRSGYEVYKWINLALLIFTFLWGLAYLNVSGNIKLLQWEIPLKWFSITLTVFFLNLVGILYEKFGDKNSPNTLNLDRYDSFPAIYLAVLHTFSGTLLLLLATISNFIEDVRLPYILVFQFLIVFGFGYLTSTRALEFSASILLLSSQLAFIMNYYYFQLPIIQSDYFLALSFILIFLSLLGSCVFEKFSSTTLSITNDIFHFIPTILLYSLSSFILIIILLNAFPIYVFLSILAISGSLLYLLGYKFSFIVMCFAGYSLSIISGLTFLYFTQKMKSHALSWEFTLPLLLTPISLIFVERIAQIQVRKKIFNEKIGKILRIIPVLLTISTLMLYGYTVLPRDLLIFYWLFTGSILMAIGILLQESIYRWASLFVILVTILRVFFVFNYISSEIYRILNFAISSVVLLTIGWLYTKNEDMKKHE
ncbi:MAG: DUF2339 domain-containing protein [Candidatus Hydrogenedentes bacterium]|nr:DUF2339 domain-containing protein [Candidatus Hydrogenedentota bacterium]